MIDKEDLVVAFSGKRDICYDDRITIHQTVCSLSTSLDIGIARFGGARGVDTVALHEAHKYVAKKALFEIVVPSKLEDQPGEAVEVIRGVMSDKRRRTILLEMGHPKYNHQRYQARNIRILMGAIHGSPGRRADLLVAFWDREPYGGTWNTLCCAMDNNIPVFSVRMVGNPID